MGRLTENLRDKVERLFKECFEMPIAICNYEDPGYGRRYNIPGFIDTIFSFDTDYNKGLSRYYMGFHDEFEREEPIFELVIKEFSTPARDIVYRIGFPRSLLYLAEEIEEYGLGNTYIKNRMTDLLRKFLMPVGEIGVSNIFLRLVYGELMDGFTKLILDKGLVEKFEKIYNYYMKECLVTYLIGGNFNGDPTDSYRIVGAFMSLEEVNNFIKNSRRLKDTENYSKGHFSIIKQFVKI